MRTTVYACDRCGTEILSGRAVVVVQAGAAPPSWPTDHENGRPALDLCPPCLDALTRWLHDPAARAVESRGTVARTGGTADE